jgi:hypothetical protein
VLPPLFYLHLKRNQISLKPQIMRTTKTLQNIQKRRTLPKKKSKGVEKRFGESQPLRERSLVRGWLVPWGVVQQWTKTMLSQQARWQKAVQVVAGGVLEVLGLEVLGLEVQVERLGPRRHSKWKKSSTFSWAGGLFYVFYHRLAFLTPFSILLFPTEWQRSPKPWQQVQLNLQLALSLLVQQLGVLQAVQQSLVLLGRWRVPYWELALGYRLVLWLRPP